MIRGEVILLIPHTQIVLDRKLITLWSRGTVGSNGVSFEGVYSGLL